MWVLIWGRLRDPDPKERWNLYGLLGGIRLNETGYSLDETEHLGIVGSENL